MEIDHIFVFGKENGRNHSAIVDAGLIETYRRSHPGQGTANICYAFDNLFLELIWVTDVDEVTSESVARTRLYERSRWCENNSCPFGIALRRIGDFATEVGDFWAYAAPFLPEGKIIRVANNSDDPTEPMIFEAPGGSSPVTWPGHRRGTLQHPRGLGEVVAIEFHLPDALNPSVTFQRVIRSCGARVVRHSSPHWALIIRAEGLGTSEPLELRLGCPA